MLKQININLEQITYKLKFTYNYNNVSSQRIRV